MNFLLTIQQPKIYLILGRIVYISVVFMDDTIQQGIQYIST
jgi:hypothetical protein